MRYIGGAELRGASGALSPRPYRSSRELSLAGLVGSDIWRPPTFVGNPGSSLQRLLRLRTDAMADPDPTISHATAPAANNVADSVEPTDPAADPVERAINKAT